MERGAIMKYFEMVERFEIATKELKNLQIEYADKKKGDVYQKRRLQLINKLDHLKRKALAIGTIGTICHVQGKRSRPHRKNPQIMVQERFNLYFVNVSDEEASALVNLHVKNAVHYKITFIRPGIIITTS